MRVADIMTTDFESITPDTAIRHAAERMRDLDVGMLPVSDQGKLVGTITDRDITIRAVANGSDPNITRAGEVMTHDLVTCYEDDDVAEAAHLMEKHQIRRLIVRNREGAAVGVLATADIGRAQGTTELGGEILHDVSQPGHH